MTDALLLNHLVSNFLGLEGNVAQCDHSMFENQNMCFLGLLNHFQNHFHYPSVPQDPLVDLLVAYKIGQAPGGLKHYLRIILHLRQCHNFIEPILLDQPTAQAVVLADQFAQSD